MELAPFRQLFVRQRHELGEWIGFETRNKYEIVDEAGRAVAFAAEQHKGILGFLLRQLLGHWRRFEIHFFSTDRQPFLVARHPFRFLFQRLEVFDSGGALIGALQQRFAILTKRFDVEDSTGQVVMEVASPFWRIWTFPFTYRGIQRAVVSKKWSGILSEALTDRDNFLVQFDDAGLSEEERRLLLGAAVFIDLQYFERKAKS